MAPYRVAGSDGGIVVRALPSTLRLRLRLNLKLMLRRSPFLVGVGLACTLPFVLVGAVVWDRHRTGIGFPTVALATEAVGASVALALAVAGAVLRSLRRPEAEARIPSQVTFYPRALVVQPRVGTAFETNWTWIQRAAVTDELIDLVISESPHTELHLARARLGDESFLKLRRWLEENKRLA